jgi:nicotinate dehydrogenase medium molybdopterin subunit
MKKQGRGVAATMYSTGICMAMNPCTAFVQVKEDGSVVLQMGTTEIGQGSSTVLAQIGAEELGVRLDDITVQCSDTETTPWDVGSVASRVTFIGGNAVIDAMRDVKKVLYETAAEELGVQPDDLDGQNGLIYVKEHPEQAIPFGDIAGKTFWEKRKVTIGKGWYQPNVGPIDPKTGEGIPFAAYEYTATAAEVEVDTETGEYKVEKLYSVVECGNPINPLLVEGQLEGGNIMGLGYGTTENMYPYYPQVDGLSPDFNPHYVTTNFSDYVVPTSMDIPAFEMAIEECPDPTGPYGAKGVGEFTMNAPAAAIANAIYNACGVRLTSLPATPWSILAGLKELETKKAG